MRKIDVSKLKECFKLVDGVLYKKYDTAWEQIGDDVKGYKSVLFDGKQHSKSRIVWALANGRDTDLFIDHIDGNIQNNHPSNLREVSHRENCINKEIHREGKLPGSTFESSRNKYAASVTNCGKQIYLGRFDTEEQANEVYRHAVALLDSYDGDSENFRKLIKTKASFPIKDIMGCSYKPKENKWQAMIQVNKERFSLGLYDDEESAHGAYLAAYENLDKFENKEQFVSMVHEISGFSRSRKKGKGCSHNPKTGRWNVQFQVNKIKMSLGTYKTEDEAIDVYEKAVSMVDKFTNKEDFKKLVLSN